MTDDSSVISRQVELLNELGLHVRPALKFVKLASQFQSEIRVCHDGKDVNGKGILDLTLLAAECGSLLQIVARGPDAAEAIEALADLVNARFGEDLVEEGNEHDHDQETAP